MPPDLKQLVTLTVLKLLSAQRQSSTEDPAMLMALSRMEVMVLPWLTAVAPAPRVQYSTPANPVILPDGKH